MKKKNGERSYRKNDVRDEWWEKNKRSHKRKERD